MKKNKIAIILTGYLLSGGPLLAGDHKKCIDGCRQINGDVQQCIIACTDKYLGRQ